MRAGQGCCSLEDFRDARRVADHLGIPYYVWNLQDAFARGSPTSSRRSISRGRTPNPCVLCNRDLKFDELWRRAGTLGAELVATGHYARIVQRRTARWRAAARARRRQGPVVLPLQPDAGGARAHALPARRPHQARRCGRSPATLGLPVAEKPESQEICFVPDRDYAGFVERHAHRRARSARRASSTRTARTLATHGGVHRFTVGQRRGLGIGDGIGALGDARSTATTGTVHVGPQAALASRGLIAEQVRWSAGAPAADDDRPVRVRIRHRHEPVAARLTHTGGDRVEAWFDEPASAVTPGQAAVFYRGDEVVGGGWIAAAL